VERFKLLSADGRVIQVTACLGVAVWRESTTSMATLLKHADEALYQGKAMGRNQSVLAD
jgi:diguanylate cyclase (GGDEF)-like protein